MTYEEYVNLFYQEVKEMTPKEQALQIIEGRIDTIAKLSVEVIDLLYNAAYNEAIDDVEKSYKKLGFKMTDLKGLKK